ncbi:MAG: cell wall metabolism sensor histidine kinase WalK, partial [Lactobacillaceae bacterium]|nr:cell wall metabolism sensor histidine kinase WalK [Lactobacillaceae bacterium]
MRHVRRFFVAIIFLMVAFALFVLITGAHPGTIIKISWHEVYIFMIVGALLLTVGAEIRQRMRARQMNLFISKLRQLQSNKTDQSHILLSPNDDYYELANTINDVQSWNRHKIQQLERQENELNALMDNMPVGAIQLAADRRIISLNLRAANLLNVATRVIGRPYDDVVNSHALMSFLERALLEKRHLHQTIELESRGETRTIDVTAEYYQTQENQFALWVLFYDVTELARLQTMQSQFVANASHELRTPLTAISGFTDTLLMGAQDDPEARQEFLEIIQRESARLLALIEDILALARMDSKHVDVKLELSQPAVVVEDILVSQQAAIAQSQLEVRVAIDTAQQLNLP